MTAVAASDWAALAVLPYEDLRTMLNERPRLGLKVLAFVAEVSSLVRKRAYSQSGSSHW